MTRAAAAPPRFEKVIPLPLRVTKEIAIPDDELQLSAVRAQGAGGQNVNKVASAAHLRFDIRASSALPEECKARLLTLRDQRISSDGIVVIKAQQYRSLERNKASALARLRSLILQAARTPKRRKPTRPSAAAERRRLDEKTRRSKLKRSRARVPDE